MSNSRRCAACKYLRRRCPKDCVFGPYFPSNNIERFSCVHKIFGASNVAKMLKRLPDGKRREAAESLVVEARSRVRDPVYGSVGTITQLRQQILEAEFELAKTQGLIALRRAQHLHEQQQQQQQQHHLLLKSETDEKLITNYNQDHFHFDYSYNNPQQQITSFGDYFSDESYLY
ncbi:LOB domain-containing protein 24-like [Spinacia oleracea]|uniref:LOB domain-containing protein 24-like n=1 Tax=Spinacia oleracea TaxID=3562 RepID=A0A9R0JTA7_SPIOL|nr:LOB domain-containing protein 24-like [Spinacia oleracea]